MRTELRNVEKNVSFTLYYFWQQHVIIYNIGLHKVSFLGLVYITSFQVVWHAMIALVVDKPLILAVILPMGLCKISCVDWFNEWMNTRGKQMPIDSGYTFGINRNVISPHVLRKDVLSPISQQWLNFDGAVLFALHAKAWSCFYGNRPALNFQTLRQKLTPIPRKPNWRSNVEKGPAWDFGLQTGEPGMQTSFPVSHLTHTSADSLASVSAALIPFPLKVANLLIAQEKK